MTSVDGTAKVDHAGPSKTLFFWWVSLSGTLTAFSLLGVAIKYLNKGLVGLVAVAHNQYVLIKAFVFDNLETILRLPKLPEEVRTLIASGIIMLWLTSRTYLLVRGRQSHPFETVFIAYLTFAILIPFGFATVGIWFGLIPGPGRMVQNGVLSFDYVPYSVVTDPLHGIEFLGPLIPALLFLLIDDVRKAFGIFLLNWAACNVALFVLLVLGGALP